MAVSVNQTLHNAMGDGSRSTHYRIIASLPNAVTSKGPSTSLNDLDVLAKAVSISGIENAPIEIKIAGHTVPVIGKTNFIQSFSITFYLDEKHQVRTTFLDWIRALDHTLPNNPAEQASFLSIGGFDIGSVNPFGSMLPGTSGAGGLTTNMTIQSMDFMEEIVTSEYKLTGVYPISIEGLSFDGSATSQIQEFTVSFKYQTYEVIKGTGLLDAAGSILDTTLSGVQSAIGPLLSGDFGGAADAFTDTFSPKSISGKGPKVSSPSKGDIFERKGIANG